VRHNLVYDDAGKSTNIILRLCADNCCLHSKLCVVQIGTFRTLLVVD